MEIKESKLRLTFLWLFTIFQLAVLACGYVINLWIISDVDYQVFWNIFYILLFGSVAVLNVYFLAWSKKSFGERLGFQLFIFTMFLIIYSISTSFL